jgi:hypothetical protein
MQHPTFSAALADQHRDELRSQADQLRLLRASRPNDPRWRPTVRRWWRLSAWPARP